MFGMLQSDGTVWLYGATGVMEELLAALPKFELWYYYRGGERIVIPGRYGWGRVLRRFGYHWNANDSRCEKDLVEWVRTLATTPRPTVT